MRIARAVRVPKPKGERFGACVLSSEVLDGPQKNAYPLDTVLATNAGSGYSFTTLAGSTAAGTVDGTGSNARFNQPGGLAVDSLGNVFVADTGNHTIRKITPAGVVSTLAGLTANNGTIDLLNWLPLVTLPNPQGNVDFTDLGATNLPGRFYRTVIP